MHRCCPFVVRVHLVGVVGVLLGCKALPPPPVIAPHATTATDPVGATTAMLVVGYAGQFLFGGDGWGVALRVEQQVAPRTTVGLELTGGRGDQAYYEDRSIFRHWLVGVRGYGRFSPDRDGPLALLSGAGLSLTTSGLVTGTLNAGVAVAYENDHAIPMATLGAALAVPLRRGRPFGAGATTFALGGHAPGHRESRQTFETPSTELFLAGGLALVVPFGGTGHRMSLDLSLAKAMRRDVGMLSLTLGDAQRFGD